MEEIQYDELLSRLHDEAVMRRAAVNQCIYIFVEGDSEELTFQMLLEHPDCGLNFQDNGIKLANYNGIGNLRHMIRLLSKTLIHNRPVIVTYDDDLKGRGVVKDLSYPMIIFSPVPVTPVVAYPNGTMGGSFEEAFGLQCFLDACFRPGVMPPSFTGTSSELMAVFETGKPWFSQIAKYVKGKGFNAGSINKVQLAKYMAQMCDPIPETFVGLAKLVLDLRASYPITHLDDVDLLI